MDRIDIYNNSKEVLLKKEEKIYLKFLILCIIFLVTLTYIILYRFNKKDSYIGYLKDNYIYLNLKENDLETFTNNNVYYADEKLKYELINLDYKEGIYELIIESSNDIKDSIVSFYTLRKNTNLYNEIIKKIWKGFK